MWFLVKVGVADPSGKAIRTDSLQLQGADLQALLLEVAEQLGYATEQLRPTEVPGLAGLLSAGLEIQVWTSWTASVESGQADQEKLRVMRRSVMGAPSSGPSSPRPSTPTDRLDFRAN